MQPVYPAYYRVAYYRAESRAGSPDKPPMLPLPHGLICGMWDSMPTWQVGGHRPPLYEGPPGLVPGCTVAVGEVWTSPAHGQTPDVQGSACLPLGCRRCSLIRVHGVHDPRRKARCASRGP